jgi:hypothetical protein
MTVFIAKKTVFEAEVGTSLSEFRSFAYLVLVCGEVLEHHMIFYLGVHISISDFIGGWSGQ